MFAVGNVRKVFSLIEELEKEQYRFTQEEKRIFYRGAFHTDSFEAVQEMIVQSVMLESGTDKRQEMLRQYAERIPESPCADAEQIEGYIFQLQQMCHEKEKAMKILEDFLEKSGIGRTESMTRHSGEPLIEAEESKEQVSNFVEAGDQLPKKEGMNQSGHRNVQEGGHLGNKNAMARNGNQRSR